MNRHSRFVPLPQTRQEKELFLGLDLGQAKDYTALAIIERTRTVTGTEENSRQYDCVHLQRWALRTSYPSIVADVMNIIKQLPTNRNTVLAVDATGCGAPVVDLFRQETFNAQLMPIQIIGGANVSIEHGFWRVPKRDLVSVVQVGLQNRALKIASALPLAETLSRELQNFTVKITDAANDVYGAWREGTHDDLVLAVAMATWAANRPVFIEDEYQTTTGITY